MCFSSVSDHRRWRGVTPSNSRALRPLKSRVHGGLRARAEARTFLAHRRAVTWPVAVRSQVVGVVLQHVHHLRLNVMERYSEVRAALRTLEGKKIHKVKVCKVAITMTNSHCYPLNK